MKEKGSIIIFVVFILIIAVAVVKFVFPRVIDNLAPASENGEFSLEEKVVPSEILASKSKYSGKDIVVHGRVRQERTSCESKQCPPDDSCCGCPEKRNLVIKDADVVLKSESQGLLRLLDRQGQPYCQRIKDSCDYNCHDWVEDGVYDVNGVFFAEPPPPGWKLSLDYYFTVENKNLIRERGANEVIGNILGEIGDKIKGFFSGGYFALD